MEKPTFKFADEAMKHIESMNEYIAELQVVNFNKDRELCSLRDKVKELEQQLAWAERQLGHTQGATDGT